MKRVLFVDDEKLVLDGLRRSLISLRKDWQMEFCQSPKAACDLVSRQPFDVVVTDMRMPGMDGAELLAVVARVLPSALRVILSGQSEMEATVRAAVIAHQFVAKPCDAGTIVDVLARTLRMHRLLEDGDLRGLASGIKGLPVPPSTYHALSKMMTDPDVELDRVAELICGDIGLVAKVLQLVNSSFFGLARHVANVRDAVSMLGLDRIKSVVLCSEVYRCFDVAKLPHGFSLPGEIQHAQWTAEIARNLLRDKATSEFAFIAAMLHDIGTWILAAYEPEMFSELYAEAQLTDRTIGELDEDGRRFPPTRLGAYLLGIWSLPLAVVEAVAFHHAPGQATTVTFDAVGAVHVADCLACALACSNPLEAARHIERIDRDFLAATGVADRLDGWVKMAGRIIGRAA